MLQLAQLDPGGPVRRRKVRGHDPKKRPATRNNRGGLHSPDACMAYNLPARRELLISHYVLDDNRVSASQGSCARRPVFNPHSFKISQKPFVKSPLRLDLKTTGCPTHDLDIAKTSLAEVNGSVQQPIEYRRNISTSNERTDHWIRHVTSQGKIQL